jgi:hypothetical protein
MTALIRFALKEEAPPFRKLATGKLNPRNPSIPILPASLAVKMLKSDEKLA